MLFRVMHYPQNTFPKTPYLSALKKNISEFKFNFFVSASI
ncbi:hypothetical protein NBRC111893_363 [Lentilactobacillus kosonis]|uniref:Uncharacterized protein n=1 Tax=Lentilactobacillus kosonis TaxID=2810561 RepID=A0A401FIQ6_9LACO|nr:hypothetical protein NBRC111893_363 [Lentilactobacillus kosonis]